MKRIFLFKAIGAPHTLYVLFDEEDRNISVGGQVTKYKLVPLQDIVKKERNPFRLKEYEEFMLRLRNTPLRKCKDFIISDLTKDMKELYGVTMFFAGEKPFEEVKELFK